MTPRAGCESWIHEEKNDDFGCGPRRSRGRRGTRYRSVSVRPSLVDDGRRPQPCLRRRGRFGALPSAPAAAVRRRNPAAGGHGDTRMRDDRLRLELDEIHHSVQQPGRPGGIHCRLSDAEGVPQRAQLLELGGPAGTTSRCRRPRASGRRRPTGGRGLPRGRGACARRRRFLRCRNRGDPGRDLPGRLRDRDVGGRRRVRPEPGGPARSRRNPADVHRTPGVVSDGRPGEAGAAAGDPGR